MTITSGVGLRKVKTSKGGGVRPTAPLPAALRQRLRPSEAASKGSDGAPDTDSHHPSSPTTATGDSSEVVDVEPSEGSGSSDARSRRLPSHPLSPNGLRRQSRADDNGQADSEPWQGVNGSTSLHTRTSSASTCSPSIIRQRLQSIQQARRERENFEKVMNQQDPDHTAYTTADQPAILFHHSLPHSAQAAAMARDYTARISSALAAEGCIPGLYGMRETPRTATAPPICLAIPPHMTMDRSLLSRDVPADAPVSETATAAKKKRAKKKAKAAKSHQRSPSASDEPDAQPAEHIAAAAQPHDREQSSGSTGSSDPANFTSDCHPHSLPYERAKAESSEAEPADAVADAHRLIEAQREAQQAQQPEQLEVDKSQRPSSPVSSERAELSDPPEASQRPSSPVPSERAQVSDAPERSQHPDTRGSPICGTTGGEMSRLVEAPSQHFLGDPCLAEKLSEEAGSSLVRRRGNESESSVPQSRASLSPQKSPQKPPQKNASTPRRSSTATSQQTFSESESYSKSAKLIMTPNRTELASDVGSTTPLSANPRGSAERLAIPGSNSVSRAAPDGTRAGKKSLLKKKARAAARERAEIARRESHHQRIADAVAAAERGDLILLSSALVTKGQSNKSLPQKQVSQTTAKKPVKPDSTAAVDQKRESRREEYISPALSRESSDSHSRRLSRTETEASFHTATNGQSDSSDREGLGLVRRDVLIAAHPERLKGTQSRRSVEAWKSYRPSRSLTPAEGPERRTASALAVHSTSWSDGQDDESDIGDSRPFRSPSAPIDPAHVLSKTDSPGSTAQQALSASPTMASTSSTPHTTRERRAQRSRQASIVAATSDERLESPHPDTTRIDSVLTPSDHQHGLTPSVARLRNSVPSTPSRDYIGGPSTQSKMSLLLGVDSMPVSSAANDLEEPASDFPSEHSAPRVASIWDDKIHRSRRPDSSHSDSSKAASGIHDNSDDHQVEKECKLQRTRDWSHKVGRESSRWSHLPSDEQIKPKINGRQSQKSGSEQQARANRHGRARDLDVPAQQSLKDASSPQDGLTIEHTTQRTKADTLRIKKTSERVPFALPDIFPATLGWSFPDALSVRRSSGDTQEGFELHMATARALLIAQIVQLPTFDQVHQRRSRAREERLANLQWCDLEGFVETKRWVAVPPDAKGVNAAKVQLERCWRTHSVLPPGRRIRSGRYDGPSMHLQGDKTASVSKALEHADTSTRKGETAKVYVASKGTQRGEQIEVLKASPAQSGSTSNSQPGDHSLPPDRLNDTDDVDHPAGSFEDSRQWSSSRTQEVSSGSVDISTLLQPSYVAASDALTSALYSSHTAQSGRVSRDSLHSRSSSREAKFEWMDSLTSLDGQEKDAVRNFLSFSELEWSREDTLWLPPCGADRQDTDPRGRDRTGKVRSSHHQDINSLAADLGPPYTAVQQARQAHLDGDGSVLSSGRERDGYGHLCLQSPTDDVDGPAAPWHDAAAMSKAYPPNRPHAWAIHPGGLHQSTFDETHFGSPNRTHPSSSPMYTSQSAVDSRAYSRASGGEVHTPFRPTAASLPPVLPEGQMEALVAAVRAHLSMRLDRREDRSPSLERERADISPPRSHPHFPDISRLAEGVHEVLQQSRGPARPPLVTDGRRSGSMSRRAQPSSPRSRQRELEELYQLQEHRRASEQHTMNEHLTFSQDVTHSPPNNDTAVEQRSDRPLQGHQRGRYDHVSAPPHGHGSRSDGSYMASHYSEDSRSEYPPSETRNHVSRWDSQPSDSGSWRMPRGRGGGGSGSRGRGGRGHGPPSQLRPNGRHSYRREDDFFGGQSAHRQHHFDGTLDGSHAGTSYHTLADVSAQPHHDLRPDTRRDFPKYEYEGATDGSWWDHAPNDVETSVPRFGFRDAPASSATNHRSVSGDRDLDDRQGKNNATAIRRKHHASGPVNLGSRATTPSTQSDNHAQRGKSAQRKSKRPEWNLPPSPNPPRGSAQDRLAPPVRLLPPHTHQSPLQSPNGRTSHHGHKYHSPHRPYHAQEEASHLTWTGAGDRRSSNEGHDALLRLPTAHATDSDPGPGMTSHPTLTISHQHLGMLSPRAGSSAAFTHGSHDPAHLLPAPVTPSDFHTHGAYTLASPPMHLDPNMLHGPIVEGSHSHFFGRAASHDAHSAYAAGRGPPTHWFEPMPQHAVPYQGSDPQRPPHMASLNGYYPKHPHYEASDGFAHAPSSAPMPVLHMVPSLP
ncbi:unnamed protein product [Parajaminaea phylloscopi]